MNKKVFALVVKNQFEGKHYTPLIGDGLIGSNLRIYNVYVHNLTTLMHPSKLN